MDVRTTDQGEAEYTQSRTAAATESGQAECSRVEIEPTKNGGFAVKKYYRTKNSSDGPGAYMEPDSYAFSNVAELSAFLQSAFGAAVEEPVTESAAPPMVPAA